MSKKSSKLYLRFKLYKNGKMVLDRYFFKKTAWWGRIEASWQKIKPSKAWLQVHYGTNMINAGVYNNLEDLKFAYQAFTEKSLIDYVQG